jgi:hypothetical protein
MDVIIQNFKEREISLIALQSVSKILYTDKEQTDQLFVWK